MKVDTTLCSSFHLQFEFSLIVGLYISPKSLVTPVSLTGSYMLQWVRFQTSGPSGCCRCRYVNVCHRALTLLALRTRTLQIDFVMEIYCYCILHTLCIHVTYTHVYKLHACRKSIWESSEESLKAIKSGNFQPLKRVSNSSI